MNPSELLHKIIVFTPCVEKYEINFDAGMKAEVIDARIEHESLKLLVDFSRFEEANKQFGVANYYDKDGKPSLFWWEAGSLYPENKRETIYLEIDPATWPFEVVPDGEPMSEYDKQNVGLILDGHGDWFGAFLLRLIAKSHGPNRAKLALGFPEEVEAVENYLKG